MKISTVCITALLIVFLTLNIYAQDKQLTLKDIIYYNPSILPESLPQLKWRGKTDEFAYVKNNSIVTGTSNSKRRDTLLTINEINTELNRKKTDSIKRIPEIDWIEKNVIMFRHNNALFLFDVINKDIRKLNEYDEEAKNTDIDKNTYRIAYTIDNNLFLAIDGKQVQITDDTNKAIVNGQEVHRREFGINKGTFWSPKGNYLAFYRKDETMVSNYPLVDITQRIAEADPIKYPMAGMSSHEVKLGIYNVETQEKIFLQTGKPADQYLTSITWGPDEKYIYVALLNRDQDHLKLNTYNARTGDLEKTLFEEKSDKYVEPQNPLYFMNSQSDKFAWLSKKDGYNHLYLYDTSGALIRQITKGEWVVSKFYGFDEDDNYAFFRGTLDSPIQKMIYSVNVENGNIRRLTNDHGTHNALFSHDKEYFIDRYSSTDVAREYKVINKDGKVKQILLTDRDPLKEYDLGKYSIFTIENNKGADLYCRLIKPVDFDSTKKYPAIIYVYGGPHSQLVSDSWLGGARLFLYYLAQNGYVVFTLDNRGTAYRGFDFESAIFGQPGTIEVEDQMKGVEYLKYLPYVDNDRIGVDGWSYGGFMTLSMILKHPGEFKAAVAGGPVIDWKYYEVMYGERYMNTPEDNPEGYENSCLLDLAKNLNCKLLIIHGTNDPIVMWQNSLLFLKECIEENIQLDYFVYPGHKHNIRGKDRMHMYEKITKFFNDNLK